MVLGRMEDIRALPETALHALPRRPSALLPFQAKAARAEAVISTHCPRGSSSLYFTDVRTAHLPAGRNSFSISSQSQGSSRNERNSNGGPFRSPLARGA
eukprot:8085619-Pyramimonas_sp.AAC.1